MLPSQLYLDNKKRFSQSSVTFGQSQNHLSSSYSTDFSLSRFAKYDRKPVERPKPAKIIYQTDKQAEKEKWMSTNVRDFPTLGNDISRNVYLRTKNEMRTTKVFMNQRMGLLKHNCAGHLTSYGLDYRENCLVPSPPFPQIPTAFMKKIPICQSAKRGTCKTVTTEARDSYRWPLPWSIPQYRLTCR